ncbi:MAG: hypothetical protein HUJ56_10015, partial [Erysipelotrichaceae bacterium]|nr:hypothetical protein [Erysipelotrichaceae bacterium]
MRNKLFISLLPLMLIIGGTTFIQQDKVSELERRFLKRNKDLANTSILDTSTQSMIDDIVNDQLIGRNIFVDTYYKLKMTLYQPFYSGLLKVADDTLILADEGYFIKSILEEDEYSLSTTDNRGYNVREFSDMYPDVKFYVYHPTRIEETPLLDQYGITSAGNTYTQHYVMQLGENVKFQELAISDLDYYKLYYNKTDLHWNIDGAYRGYSDIITMVQEDFDIDPVREHSEKACFPQEFYGNLANNIARNSDYDHICDYTLKGMKDYTYYVNGEMVDDQLTKDAYAQGIKEDAYSDYDCYYGSNYFERVYDFNQEDKPNVLILCDSYI